MDPVSKDESTSGEEKPNSWVIPAIVSAIVIETAKVVCEYSQIHLSHWQIILGGFLAGAMASIIQKKVRLATRR